MRNRRIPLVIGWLAALAATLWFLHGPASHELGVPITSPGALSDWAESTAGDTMALALVRIVAIVVAWYLLAATVLAVMAHVVGAHPLSRLVGAVTPRVVHRVVTGTTAATLVAGAIATTPVAAAPSASGSGTQARRDDAPLHSYDQLTPSTATLRRLPDGEVMGDPPATRADLDSFRQPATATLRRLPEASSPSRPGGTGSPQRTGPAATAPDVRPAIDPGGETTTPTMPVPGQSEPAASAHGTARADGSAGATWTVAPGDSFWSIAEEAVAETLGRAPTDREVDHYWRHLVDVNRGRLADPDNPDLLLPGQALMVPPVAR